MSMQKNNNIWYDLLKGIFNYLREDKYPINDTGINCIEIVSYKENPNLDVDYSYINVNIPGNYFVKDDNTIYDEALNIVQVLDSGDTFTIDNITYFINEDINIYNTKDEVERTIDKSVHEYGRKWNNTRVGNAGIKIDAGKFELDDDTDFTTWDTPQVMFMNGLLSNNSPTEKKTTTRAKTQNFSMIFLVTETDLYKNKFGEEYNQSGYDITYGIVDIMSKLMYDYFNSRKCANLLPVSQIDWTSSFDFIAEERPIIVSIQENELTFR